jgi:hypothetical protein
MMKNLKKNILKKVLNILDMKNSIQIWLHRLDTATERMSEEEEEA